MRRSSRDRQGRAAPSVRDDDRASRPIAVLLAIPHRLDRELFQVLLTSRRSFSVAAMAGTRSELEAATVGPRPDVVLLELTGPAVAGRLRVVDVRHHFPGVPVLATAAHDQDECPILRLARERAESGQVGKVSPMPDCLAVAVMQGVHGAIRRSVSIDELCAALQRTASGATWFDDSLLAGFVRWSRFASSKPGKAVLSDREVDVARRIAGGHSNKEIASQLGVSEPTVKKHVGRLMEKLEQADRLQLGLFLVRHRFLLQKAHSPLARGDSDSPGLPADSGSGEVGQEGGATNAGATGGAGADPRRDRPRRTRQRSATRRTT